MASIDKKLRRAGGIAAGVPTLRHALALAVLLAGAIEVNVRYATLRLGVFGIVPLAAPTMLLAVSGFLFARSADGRYCKTLLWRYWQRLAPPLVVSLLFTILALALLSNLSLYRYFTAPETWRYLANAVGWSSTTLPGVFEFNNASATINATLWIVPIMLIGSVVAAVVAIAPAIVRSVVLFAGCAAIFGFAFAIDLGWIDTYAVPRGLRPLVDPQVVAAAAGLLLGMLAFDRRRRVPTDALFLVATIAVIAVCALFPRYWVDSAVAQAMLAVPLSYLAVTLAVARLPTPWPFDRATYSLGLVLYAYPVEQACIALRGYDQSLGMTLLLSLPITMLLAAASWHLVERPLLARRRTEPVKTLDGSLAPRPAIRPLGWYAARISGALPGAVMIVSFSVIMLAVLAMVMFALQRDQPGM